MSTLISSGGTLPVAAALLLHLAALAGLLVMARRSVLLVDEDGRPLPPRADWLARTIPCVAEPAAPLACPLGAEPPLLR